jgi:hypothetical protein
MDREKKCLDVLLDSSVTLEEKAAHFSDFLAFYEAVGRNTGLGVRSGRVFAYEQLVKALPQADSEARSQLDDVVAEICEHLKKEKRQSDREARALARELRSLKEGTPILILNEDREDLVRLVEVKLTRFVCEYPDGRRYSVPMRNFIRVSSVTAFDTLPEDVRGERELVRALAGSHFEHARDRIVKQGAGVLAILLDELAAALVRIKEAPVGLSGGAFGASLGPVKKVNPRDQALAKRIPKVVAEIAGKTGVEGIKRRIQEHPDAAVRGLCMVALGKLGR